MSEAFQEKLDHLAQRLLSMARQAEATVQQAVQALLQRDNLLAQKVQDEDSFLDQLEIEVDELGIHLLATAPADSQLRLITVAMRVAHDLERVGDEATTIARRVLDINKQPPLLNNPGLETIASCALDMLHTALNAFVHRDTAQARAVIPRDKEVDRANKELHQQLANRIVQTPNAVDVCLNHMVISKSLERVADHATNLAEQVVYLCEELDIRHSNAPLRG